MKSVRLVCILPAALALAACESAKSSNPLSPSVAGPMPGVEISVPKTLEPVGIHFSVDQQPVTLLIENSSSNSPRPLSYRVEIATDVNFATKVFERTNIPPGENGRTSLRLPDPLAPERSYFWRVKAEDGANESAFSAAAAFDVFTPVVIDAPQPIAPAPNAVLATRRPTFTFLNARRSGPAGAIGYVIEVSASSAFTSPFTIGPVPEQPNQTSVDSPQDAPYDAYLFWHVRATDGVRFGPWSPTLAFSTPSSTSTPSPGGGTGSGHVGPGPLNAERARQVVYGTYAEFPNLSRVFGSEGEAVAAADELLRRTLWHLELAGFQAAGQKNPSGAISSDKITIFFDGYWHLYDVYSLGFAGRATTVQFVEIAPDGANPYPKPPIPD